MKKLFAGCMLCIGVCLCCLSPEESEPTPDLVPYMSDIHKSAMVTGRVEAIRRKTMTVVCYGDIPEYDGHVYETEILEGVSIGDDVRLLVNGSAVIFCTSYN